MPSTSTTPPLTCPCCHIAQAKQYCQKCLQSGLASHSSALSTLQHQLAISTKRCAHLLYEDATGKAGHGVGLERWRIVRAGIAEKQRTLREVREQVKQREHDLEAAKSRINELKATLPSRRDNLSRVSLSHDRESLESRLASVATQQADISQRLVHARTVLVKEAIDVFGVRRRDGGARPWEVAGLALPPTAEFKAHPSSLINAALKHTLHLLSLLTTYLSISLPFEPTAPPPFNLPHVGRPIMKANTPFLGTTKWREKWVLWMSSTAATLAPQEENASERRKRGHPKGEASSRAPSIAQSIADMSIFSSGVHSTTTSSSGTLAKTLAKHRHFLTAYALLAHSIAYLAWTQGVEGIGLQESSAPADDDEDGDQDGEFSTPDRSRSGTPVAKRSTSSLISPTDILNLLAQMATSPQLGRRSHEPGSGPGLGLRHMGFGLDVSKVVRSVLDAEGGTDAAEGGNDGWDMLDAD